MKHLSLLFVFFPFIVSAQDMKGNVLKKLLAQYPEKFAKVLKNSQQHKLQILYTQINRDAQGLPTFKSYSYGINTKNYFYPASLAKLPVCALALEKLGEIGKVGKETNLVFGAARPSQTPLTQDSLSPTGFPNIANYIKRSLVVSDNETYNRLYEFLGQEYIQQKLAEKGYEKTLISHRLSRPIYEEEAERHTNPCAFMQDSQVVWKQDALYNTRKHHLAYRKTQVGKAYYKRGELINKPYQFKGRNFMPLPEMQRMLQAIIFPEALPTNQRFKLTIEDYTFLQTCLGMYPRESEMPVYKEKFHTDDFMKYCLRDKNAPEQVRIFNKVGMAFGFLIDNAYMVDFEANTEFMLSVVIYANADETLNDDKYEYETISKPFMQDLAETIGTYERKRSRKFLPNLEKWKKLNFRQ
jgi:hypothetical protein